MSRKLFVGGISYDTNDDGLKTYFEQFGEVVDAKVIMDRHTDKSRGFGFVTMAKAEDAKKCEDTAGQKLDGRKIEPRIARETKIYVGGVKPGLTREDLEEYFSSNFGRVSSVDVVKDKETQENRGFAFIGFDENKDAWKALKYEEGCGEGGHMIKGFRVQAKQHIDKRAMAQQYYGGYSGYGYGHQGGYGYGHQGGYGGYNGGYGGYQGGYGGHQGGYHHHHNGGYYGGGGGRGGRGGYQGGGGSGGGDYSQSYNGNGGGQQQQGGNPGGASGGASGGGAGRY